MNQPVEGVDARTDRFAQGAVGVALLAAFVFRVPWLVPGLSLLLAVGAVAGPQASGLLLAFERWVIPRLPTPGLNKVGFSASAIGVPPGPNS